jgi:hypothetical protein
MHYPHGTGDNPPGNIKILGVRRLIPKAPKAIPKGKRVFPKVPEAIPKGKMKSTGGIVEVTG